MEEAVLVLRPIGCGQARYYLDGSDPGHWQGTGVAALGLAGAVDEEDFAAVLAGRRGDGSALLARIPKNRRAGFDLMFAAPKSVSLLAALAAADESAKIAGAHHAAVADAVDYLERWAIRTRRGRDERRIVTGGIIGAAFVHHTSRAGDPHLHTHVVVANVVLGRDGRWSCIDRLSLWQHARAVGALYQTSLRHHVATYGLHLAWKVRADGLADVEGVPRPAIDACSSRRRQVLAEAAASGLTSARGRAAVAGRTRRTGSLAEQSWEARAAGAGLDRTTVANLLSASASPSASVSASASGAASGAASARGGLGAEAVDVEGLLIGKGSAFTRPDVVAAVAVAAPVEAGAAAVEQEADHFLRSAVPINARRWTTVRARSLDDAMVAMVDGRWRSAGLVPPDTVEAAITSRPGLDGDQQAAVRRLTIGGSGVDVLAPGCLVRQAGVVDAARAAWEAAGHRVAVLTRSEDAEARWRALTAIGPPPPRPNRASVVIVDGADHWPTIALHGLVDDTASRGGKLVLVAGGTSPPRREPACSGVAALADRVGAIRVGPDGTHGVTPGPIADIVRAGRDGTVVVAPTPADAARRLVADWHATRAGPNPAAMVALGPDEAEYLNRLARATRAAAGELTGPALHAGSRDFQAGDDVRVLRHDRRVGVPVGSCGRVTGVDPGRCQATICWGDRTMVVAASALAGGAVTHGYATTPGYLREGRQRGLGGRGGLSEPGGLGGPGGLSGLGGLGEAGAILAFGPYRGPGATIYTVTPAAVRRPRLDPVGDLVAALNPAARAGHPPAGRSLADLYDERSRLGAALLASAPPNVSGVLRRVDEDRAWLTMNPAHGSADRLAELDRRRQTLGQAQRQRSAWLESHRDDLERWAALDDAVIWRAEALGRAAELAPTRAVADRLGQPPPDEPGRQVWREVAGAIEAYRDRWAIPDGPLMHSSGLDPSWDRARQVDRLHVLGACRAADRSRGRGVAVDNDLALSAC
jgi:conjugative relaxase-like TrwC/TraI family protein